MKSKFSDFSKSKLKYFKFIKSQEIQGNNFNDKLGQFNKFYFPLCNFINKVHNSKKKPVIIGLSGGQGSGKTTIVQILEILLKINFKLNVVYFSIDDFYKTLNQRKKMSKNIHSLFLTRGVPGTHDISLLKKTFYKLLKKNFKSFYLPKFDKSIDDRLPKKKWKKIKTKPDIIIFEGWCVGAAYQEKNIKRPINILEKREDKKSIWRNAVNNQLKKNYKNIFNLIDKQIFLKVPSFKFVYKWRLLQEKKLKRISMGKKVMSNLQIKKFIMHYERITKQMLKDHKKFADVVININRNHKFDKMKIN